METPMENPRTEITSYDVSALRELYRGGWTLQFYNRVDDSWVNFDERVYPTIDGYPDWSFAVNWRVDPSEMDLLDEADPGDMDGDAASALSSAGWGTDEDYGG